MTRVLGAILAAFLFGGLLSAAASVAAGQAATPQPKWVVPIRGVADIGILKPVTKVVKDEVITTIKVKNLSAGTIAGLKVDEYWYDAQGNMLPGDSYRHRKPLMPGEVITVELHTPKNAKMNRNSYQFSHANGTIKAKTLTTLDEPKSKTD